MFEDNKTKATPVVRTKDPISDKEYTQKTFILKEIDFTNYINVKHG